MDKAKDLGAPDGAFPLSVAVCDPCMTAIDGLTRLQRTCDGETCPLHDVCARCGGITNGRRILSQGTISPPAYSKSEAAHG